MSKIRVIDLLNKMANGEEVPEKIKYDNDIFIYDKDRKDYIHQLDSDGWVSETLLFKMRDVHFFEGFINVKVEIIEEEPEIDIQGIEELQEYLHIGDKQEEDVKDRTNIKINELIKAIKQLDKKIKEK